MTKRAQFIVLALAFSLVTAFGADSLPGHSAILPVSEGPALLKQCSRGAPTNVTGFWTPSPSQIIAIEKLLPELRPTSGHKLKLSGSYRQYVGITVHGKNLIYLNSFPGSVLSEFKASQDWHIKAVIVCDGGDAFWGAEFDPADNTFHNLAFNGWA